VPCFPTCYPVFRELLSILTGNAAFPDATYVEKCSKNRITCWKTGQHAEKQDLNIEVIRRGFNDMLNKQDESIKFS